MLIHMAVGLAMDKNKRYEELVEKAFNEFGFLVHEKPDPVIRGFDLTAQRNGRLLVIDVKVAPEGRPDRLSPLLAEAILQVRMRGRKHDQAADLVAIVAAPRVSPKTAKAVLKFGRELAPDVAVGVFDLDGYRIVTGNDLEKMNTVDRLQPSRESQPLAKNLFSDLNQWMLKLLLARHLNRPEFMGGPVAQYRNASELAAPDAANVAIMSAFRLIDQLKQQGFLHESSPVLQLVRARELLRQWQGVYQRPVRELPVRWLLPTDSPAQLSNAVKAYGQRSCVALFPAAHAHGFRHVTGVPIHVYVDSIDEPALQRMGVVVARPGEKADLILRIPLAKESVFRGMVMVGRGYRAADILQVWLDVASHPSRGQEQADLIYRKVIEPRLTGM